MQKFILKTSFFVVPFALLYIFSLLFYDLESGDLLRIGYIFDRFPHYRENFKSTKEQPIRYIKMSELPAEKKYKLLTIGDSFSNQNESSYQNYLAKEIDVLHVDRFLTWDNPLQALFGLANGDFFDTIKVDYVVLQSVERYFITRSKPLHKSAKINFKDIRYQIAHHDTSSGADNEHKFFSNQSLKFAYNSLMFFTNDDYFFEGTVYKAKLKNDNLFSVRTDDLLFYADDVKNLKHNNNAENVSVLNAQLNYLDSLLKKKNITLIVLPSPDKYDVYFDALKIQKIDKKPRFFELLGKDEKNYIYIDSKTLLQKAMNTEKDIYFYDDTHWSPLSAELISREIIDVMDNN